MTIGDIEQRLANVYAKGLVMLLSGEKKTFTGTVTLPEALGNRAQGDPSSAKAHRCNGGRLGSLHFQTRGFR